MGTPKLTAPRKVVLGELAGCIRQADGLLQHMGRGFDCETEFKGLLDRTMLLLEKFFSTRDEASRFQARVILAGLNRRITPAEQVHLFIAEVANVTKRLDVYDEPSASGVAPTPPGADSTAPTVSKRVFVVHGHDHAMRDAVARFVDRELSLEAVSLGEQPDEGAPIIEKFEKHGQQAGFALALLSPDDSCGDTHRARQNVIFELGYFVGRLGRRHVRALYQDGVEIPSDLQGVLYIPYDAHGGWKTKLRKEMEAVGLMATGRHGPG